jgi:branched-chain amino acid transport system ATP-binding protein
MRLEENEIFPRAERSLPESDWLAIAEAFGANEEPLFGTHRRKEFERPYQRIANLAPRKLKLSRRDPV